MIDKVWEERIKPELILAEAIAEIYGKNILIDHFSQWPTFEDAEILSLEFNRGNHWWVIETEKWNERIPPSLIATFYVFDSRYADDSPKRKPTKVIIQFEEFERFEIEGFNYQNPILGLGIKFEFSNNLKQNLFSVNWGGAALGHEASFTCNRMQVLSVEPMVWPNPSFKRDA